jgi:hypothetical protein
MTDEYLEEDRHHFETPPELHTDDQDISCSRCHEMIPNTRKAGRALRDCGRPTTDTCWLLPGLHVHPMNRRHFTCAFFSPKRVML